MLNFFEIKELLTELCNKAKISYFARRIFQTIHAHFMRGYYFLELQMLILLEILYYFLKHVISLQIKLR